jgi:ligand-binding SRPBCC domain-containing protein
MRITLVVAALLAVVALGVARAAAAPPAAARAALATILANDNDFHAACTPAQQRAVVATAQLSTLGRLDGDDVVLAAVFNPCICGAQNCPFYVIRVTPGHPRELLAAMGVGLEKQSASPLPRIVVRMHDSAAVAAETIYAYRNGQYASVEDTRFRWSDKAHKPSSIPVRFAANASSAPLRGRVSLGWYDTYQFAANGGQRVLIDGVRSRAHVTLTLYGPGDRVATLTAGKPYALPATGTYRLQVDNDAEEDTPYALTLAIR